MSTWHGSFSIYQHTNATNAADPNIGFFVCRAPTGGIPTPIPAASLTAVYGSAVTLPIADLATATLILNAVVAYQQAQNALDVTMNSPSNVLVAGPVVV